jgi:hypothetical protein
MSKIHSIDTPYFLTKQTANLREDFGREIRNSASLFLLYGEEGVGKTRLLKELVSTSLNELRIHWVDCKENDYEANAATELSSALEGILDIATIGDVIVADHFELATNKIKHQLLQSWSTDGIDKKFNLIIATSQTGIEEIRNLAARYRLNVKSFQLLPLTPVEIDGYCASTLFPSLPPSPLSMPKLTRRALNETRGVIGKVREVVEQHSNHIVTQGPSSSPSIIKPLLVCFGLTFILVLVGLAYHFIPAASDGSLSLNQHEEEMVELAQLTDNSTTGVPAVEVDGSQVLSIIEPTEVTQAPVIVEPIIAEPGPEPVAALALVETIGISVIKKEEFSDTQIVEVNEVEDEVEVDKVPKGEPVKDKSLVDNDGKEPYSDWFMVELKRSRDWFERKERSRGTIQIMSIRLDSDTDDAYLSYVETLQKKGVDVSQLRAYLTRIREELVLGIVFGEYDSRRVAYKSLTDLPSSLGANQPFPRSVGGIWDEINQL